MWYATPGSSEPSTKVRAQLTAFSASFDSPQSEAGSTSVVVTSNSCALTDAIPSTPALPFGLVVCPAQALRQRLAFPTKEYRTWWPEVVPDVCHPQYRVQNPDDSFTLVDVSTK